MNLNIKQNKKLQKARDVKIPKGYFNKIDSGSNILNDVLGGGFVKGSSICFYAKAGQGKSTLMLNTMQLLSDKGLKGCYCSGEESIIQLSNTCKRINTPEVNLANLTNIDEICQLVKDEKINFLVIDSIPSLTTSTKMNNKVKEEYIINKIVSTAKETGCIIICILHQTKEGKFLGGTGIIHAVDVELKLSNSYNHSKSPKYTMPKDKRCFSSIKNRFGSPSIVELTMTNTGFNLNYKPIIESEPYITPIITESTKPVTKHKNPNILTCLITDIKRNFRCWILN